MTNDDALVVLCTVPVEGDHAARIARRLVEARLAACVGVLGPLRSVYRWDGKVVEDSELQLVIKTRRAHFAALERAVVSEHPYTVPELLALPVAEGSCAYLAWLGEATQTPNQ